MKSLLLLSLVTLLLLSCASHVKRLDCERHLRPINAPAPVASFGAHP
jgi:hypothetical protein